MAKYNAQSRADVRQICARHAAFEAPLLPILHDIQACFGYVPDGAIADVAQALNQSRADVFGVLSFYHDFHRQPQHTHTLKVCRAEACQAVGGRAVWSAAESAAANGGDVDLEAVYCLGNCACAPSVQLDGRTIGRMDPHRVTALFTSGARSGAPS